MKTFYFENIESITTGCQPKGIVEQYDDKKMKNILYYVKEEDDYPFIKNTNNMILYECLTSKIFQKLGINTVQYHFANQKSTRVRSLNKPMVCSESFVKKNESQFSLESVFKYSKYNSVRQDKLSPSYMLRGEKIFLTKSQNREEWAYTFLDENIDVLREFVNNNSYAYPGEIKIDFEQIRTDLTKQLIGDMLCYNGDRHSGNVVFISQVVDTPSGKGCIIKLAPSFDFGYAFFADREENELKRKINTNGIPYMLDKMLMFCMSLKDYGTYSGHNEFVCMRDYIQGLSENPDITKQEKEILDVISRVKDINIKQCFREVFCEELDNVEPDMSLKELISLYNGQMNKNITMDTITNVERLFDYTRDLLLCGEMVARNNYEKSNGQSNDSGPGPDDGSMNLGDE